MGIYFNSLKKYFAFVKFNFVLLIKYILLVFAKIFNKSKNNTLCVYYFIYKFNRNHLHLLHRYLFLHVF